MPEVENQVQAEEEEDEDGPPPGFHSIIRLPPTQSGKDEAAPVDDDDDDGPPPGFECFAPKPTSSLPSSDAERGSEHQDTEDDDGPPPGWEFSSLARALPKTPSITIDEKNERVEEIKDGEDEDDGPPPGWETVLPHQIPLPFTPPLQPSSAVSSEIEMGSKLDITRTDDEVPRSVSTPKPVSGRSSPPTPPLKQGPEIGCQEGDGKNCDKNSKSAKQSVSLKQPIPPAANPPTPPMASSSEKGQLVCGTCRKLLLYPRGAKWVKCPGCQDLNFVLEAHEVGQVKCGGCTTLLMYPHGAPAVQCSSCHAVTEIGDHNRRPPLSVQQAQAQAQTQAQRRRRRNRVR